MLLFFFSSEGAEQPSNSTTGWAAFGVVVLIGR